MKVRLSWSCVPLGVGIPLSEHPADSPLGGLDTPDELDGAQIFLPLLSLRLFF